MLTAEELDILKQPEVRDFIISNIESDPAWIALKCKEPYRILASRQIRNLQKIKGKLPSYYAACCVIPDISLEQASGESISAKRTYSGDLCIDLTCGLGVDSYYLSKKFRKVISLEIDPVLSEIARYNFNLLGVSNIEVVTTEAERFLQEYQGARADLVFADPARRGHEGSRLYSLHECSPDITTILPAIKELSVSYSIKLSPMFDIEEVFRFFGENVSINIYSSHRQCREVNVENGLLCGNGFLKLFPGNDKPVVYSARQRSDANGTGVAHLIELMQEGSLRYLVHPDPVFVKARMCTTYYTDKGLLIPGENSFAFCSELPNEISGMIFEIEQCMPYSQRSIRKILKDRGIKRLNIIKKGIRDDSATIARSLSIKEGGEVWMAVTAIGQRQYAFMLKPLW